jgi:hypothetical protein
MRLRDEVVQLSQGEQTLGERVGAAHDLQWASNGSNTNESAALRDDVISRYFGNLLERQDLIIMFSRTGGKVWLTYF